MSFGSDTLLLNKAGLEWALLAEPLSERGQWLLEQEPAKYGHRGGQEKTGKDVPGIVRADVDAAEGHD